MPTPRIQRLAYPGVVALVAFLALSSQVLFHYIAPGPLAGKQAWIFNGLVAALLICYSRACFTNAGMIRRDWQSTVVGEDEDSVDQVREAVQSKQRWCGKCEASKPPRAHHCKTCKRCIPKMDHHCVWTANCVSHVTLPHFLRFLLYAVAAMLYLEYFLTVRALVVWRSRDLPSYLGPNVWQLVHIFVLCVTNSLVMFALTLLLGRNLWSLSLNMTTIEGWEIERHHALLRRARVLGGYLEGPNGSRIRIERQEFPWDIGILANVCEGMGNRNPLAWFWPFSSSPSIQSGLSYPDNGIEDPPKPWPPPDPDRLFRIPRRPLVGDGFTQPIDIDAFRKRQEADQARFSNEGLVLRLRPFHERYDASLQQQECAAIDSEGASDYDGCGTDYDGCGTDSEDDEGTSKTKTRTLTKGEGEEAWRNAEGERLDDFGVDEEADFYDEDDLSIAELIRRRQAA